MSNAESFVKLCSYSGRLDAEVAKSYLESEGFEVQVLGDDLSGLAPHLSLTRGVDVKVKQKDFLKANQVLTQLTKLSEELHKEDEAARAEQLGESKTRGFKITGQMIFGIDIVWWIVGGFFLIQILMRALGGTT